MSTSWKQATSASPAWKPAPITAYRADSREPSGAMPRVLSVATVRRATLGLFRTLFGPDFATPSR